MAQRAIAPTELRRFTARFSPAVLLDQASRAYRDSGMAYMRLDDYEMFERLLNNQRLIRLPLIRSGDELTVGVDDGAWSSWLKDASQR